MNKYKIITYAIGMFSLATVAGAATLTISPASGTYASGETFTVNVMMDTTSSAIDGVDLRYLNFNPGVLQVVDSNAGTSGVQVSPGSLMPSTLSNSVDNVAGRITFSQIVVGGQHYTGSGTLFSITFRAVSGGTGSLSIDSVAGRTTDSNIASAGADILASAGSAQYSITGAVTAQPTPVPTPATPTYPIPAPTPTPGSQITNPGRTLLLYRTLYYGMSGTDVTSLQNYLIESGYLATGNNGGFFGNLTKGAVQKFQCALMQICSGSQTTNGYGMVGARTRAVLAAGTGTPATPATPSGSSTLTLSRTVMFGARGADITNLQNYLIVKGYLTAGSNSGYFGAMTRAAVRQFQCAKLQICSGTETSNGYGLVGARTRASMMSN